jgi:hypothetical protein
MAHRQRPHRNLQSRFTNPAGGFAKYRSSSRDCGRGAEVTPPMKSTLHKTIVITLTGLAFSILGFTIFVDEHFYRTRPREPELASGRIFPEEIHGGTRVYLTRMETWPLEYSWYACGAVSAIAFLLNQRWRCFGPFK